MNMTTDVNADSCGQTLSEWHQSTTEHRCTGGVGSKSRSRKYFAQTVGLVLILGVLAGCGASEPERVTSAQALDNPAVEPPPATTPILTTEPVSTTPPASAVLATPESAPVPTAEPAPASSCSPLDTSVAEGLIANGDTGTRYAAGEITAAAWTLTSGTFEGFPESVFYSVVVQVGGLNLLFGLFSNATETPNTGIAFWQASNSAAEVTGFPTSSRPTEGLADEYTSAALACLD